ncbi:MAG: hypothetical protein FJ106_09230 [Deltaproteobacteria bacterium]|nr:hypothetical protein [Deltaproteobacteria bacterium]
MSIRAHRVEEIRTSGESFNLWHDEKIIKWLEKKTFFFESLNEDCCGLTGVEVDDLKAMLSEIGGQISEWARKAIEEDIKMAKSKDDWYVQYHCY